CRALAEVDEARPPARRVDETRLCRAALLGRICQRQRGPPGDPGCRDKLARRTADRVARMARRAPPASGPLITAAPATARREKPAADLPVRTARIASHHVAGAWRARLS